MPYPNLEDNNERVAAIYQIAPLVRGIKTSTSATGKHIGGIRDAAILKILVNTPIPTLGTIRAIADIYLSWTLAFKLLW